MLELTQSPKHGCFPVSEEETPFQTKCRNLVGTTDPDLAMQLFVLCADAYHVDKKADSCFGLEQLAQALPELHPNDAIEGMLVTRMMALHKQGMEMLAKSTIEGLIPQLVDHYVTMATKLLRLYNETLDTLIKYRRKGEQRVVVQHVNVADGGRAIVGNVMGG